MRVLEFLVGFAALALALATIIDVVGRRYGGGKTAAWVLFVLVVPFVGAAVYWVRRPATQHEVDQAYLVQAERQRDAERRPIV